MWTYCHGEREGGLITADPLLPNCRYYRAEVKHNCFRLDVGGGYSLRLSPERCAGTYFMYSGKIRPKCSALSKEPGDGEVDLGGQIGVVIWIIVRDRNAGTVSVTRSSER